MPLQPGDKVGKLISGICGTEDLVQCLLDLEQGTGGICLRSLAINLPLVLTGIDGNPVVGQQDWDL